MANGVMEKRTNPKWIADKASSAGIWGGALWTLGFIFAILGISADPTGSLGLTSMSWFLLAIVFHLAGLSCWMGWALGVYLKSK